MISGSDVLETRSPEDTGEVGERLASELHAGDILLLMGDIGTGKSVLARGLGTAMGIQYWRGSPTFNLIHEYATRPPLYHLDLYRLGTAEVEDLGLEEYARPDAILVVEWAERASAYLQTLAWGRVIQIDLEYLGGNMRRITFHRAAGEQARLL